ncbi:MAG: lysostaphin resistance A-like protein [Hyphomicrobiaceae bacterium]
MENQKPERSKLLRGPPAYVPRTPWGGVPAAAAAVVILAVALASAAVAQLLGMVPVSLGGARLGQDPDVLRTLALWQVLTIALTLMASGLFGGKALEVLALHQPAGSPLVYLEAIGLMLLMQVAVSGVQYVFFSDDMYADLRPLVGIFGDQWLLALLVVGIGAPLSEELLFRGFLLSALARSQLGFAGGTIITTTWWTLLHWGYSAAGILEVFLIGLFLSWLLWRTGSLRVPIFCHALYNSLIVVFLRHVPLPP